MPTVKTLLWRVESSVRLLDSTRVLQDAVCIRRHCAETAEQFCLVAALTAHDALLLLLLRTSPAFCGHVLRHLASLECNLRAPQSVQHTAMTPGPVMQQPAAHKGCVCRTPSNEQHNPSMVTLAGKRRSTAIAAQMLEPLNNTGAHVCTLFHCVRCCKQACQAAAFHQLAKCQPVQNAAAQLQLLAFND
jgi:hypothetical protein